MTDIKILCLILIAHIWVIYAVPHRFVEPEGLRITPSFLRGSVEFIPSDDEKLASLKVLPLDKSGDEESMQFSRSAVESIPKTIVSYYQPLRSAVEHNPHDGDYEVFDTYSKVKSRKQKFLDIVHFSRQSRGQNTDAYVVPARPYDNDPHNYRGESPYQQLVDEKTYSATQMHKIEQTNLRVGALKRREYKVICHTTNWSFYRKGEGKFVPENLDYNLCTHIIYSFATLDPESLLMNEFDPWADIENKLYTRTVKLAKGRPVFLAIGGWTDSVNGKYSKLVSDKKLRANFIENAVPFLKRFGFAGLHVDWNYPVCPQSDCKRGNPSDKTYFTQFIKELQYGLQQSDLRLSISISGYKEIITQAYEFAALSKAVDFMTIMTFDYHGASEDVTGHVSPLYGSQSDKYPQYNTDYAIRLLIDSGADRDKIIMGVPFYGQSFTLKSSESGFNAPAEGPGYPGDYTLQPGMLAFHEICSMIRAGYRKGNDPYGNSGPYITNGKTWAGYDDVDMVMKKARYVMDNELGGVSAWTVDLDDFTNSCCFEPFPLLRAINRALGRISSALPKGTDCSKPAVTTPPPAVMTSTVDSGQAGIPNQSTYYSTQSTTSWWSQSTTTTNRPPTSSTDDSPIIPNPVNTMPVVNDGEMCNKLGAYRPDQYSCEIYWVCAQDQWRQQRCPSGLHWNAGHQHCDWPQSAGCTAKESTVKPTTARPISTTKPSKRTTALTTPQTTRTTTRRTTTQRTQKPITTTQRPLTTQRPTYYETTTMYYTTTVLPQTTYRTTTQKRTTARPTTPRTTVTVRTTQSTTKKTNTPQETNKMC